MENRRTFIRGAGALTLGAVALTLPELASANISPDHWKVRFELSGFVPFSPDTPYIVAAQYPIPLPPAFILPLVSRQIDITVKQSMSDDVTQVEVWVEAGPNIASYPSELPPPPFPISIFSTKISEVIVDTLEENGTKLGQIVMMGKIIANPVPSPFGTLIGRLAAYTLTFDRLGENVNFKFVGGFAANSHSTWTPSATGNLYLRPKRR